MLWSGCCFVDQKVVYRSFRLPLIERHLVGETKIILGHLIMVFALIWLWDTKGRCGECEMITFRRTIRWLILSICRAIHLTVGTDQGAIWHIWFPGRMPGLKGQHNQRRRSLPECMPSGCHTDPDRRRRLLIRKPLQWLWNPNQPGRGDSRSAYRVLYGWWEREKKKMVRRRL